MCRVSSHMTVFIYNILARRALKRYMSFSLSSDPHIVRNDTVAPPCARRDVPVDEME